jgi:hypothetical protein
MIELIGIVACLIACIAAPFIVKSIRSGAAFKKAPEKRAELLTAFRKQFTWLGWVGLVFGVLEMGMYFITDEPGEGVFKVVAGVLWLVLSGLCFYGLRSIANVPAIAPGA